MTPPALPDTLAELNALSQFFIKAEDTIKGGQAVDMTGIDQRINALCTIVQEAIPEQQEIYLPELTALLNLLNSCEIALRVMQTTETLKEVSNAGD